MMSPYLLCNNLDLLDKIYCSNNEKGCMRTTISKNIQYICTM